MAVGRRRTRAKSCRLEAAAFFRWYRKPMPTVSSIATVAAKPRRQVSSKFRRTSVRITQGDHPQLKSRSINRCGSFLAWSIEAGARHPCTGPLDVSRSEFERDLFPSFRVLCSLTVARRVQDLVPAPLMLRVQFALSQRFLFQHQSRNQSALLRAYCEPLCSGARDLLL